MVLPRIWDVRRRSGSREGAAAAHAEHGHCPTTASCHRTALATSSSAGKAHPWSCWWGASFSRRGGVCTVPGGERGCWGEHGGPLRARGGDAGGKPLGAAFVAAGGKGRLLQPPPWVYASLYQGKGSGGRRACSAARGKRRISAQESGWAGLPAAASLPAVPARAARRGVEVGLGMRCRAAPVCGADALPRMTTAPSVRLGAICKASIPRCSSCPSPQQ